MNNSGWENGDDEFLSQQNNLNEKDENAVSPENALGTDEPEKSQKNVPTLKKKRNTFTDKHLMSADGLRKIHTTFPYVINSNVLGKEGKALSDLITNYKEWAFELFPALAFEDFLDRTEAIGKTSVVQNEISDLRIKERRKHCPEEEEKMDEDVPADEDLDQNRISTRDYRSNWVNIAPKKTTTVDKEFDDIFNSQRSSNGSIQSNIVSNRTLIETRDSTSEN